jgi:hypothetical protein
VDEEIGMKQWMKVRGKVNIKNLFLIILKKFYLKKQTRRGMQKK